MNNKNYEDKGVNKITRHGNTTPWNMEYSYIGCTNRTSTTRFKEHNIAFYNKHETMVAKHL